MDNVQETFEMHPSGLVQGEICKLWMEFQDKRKSYSLGNLTLNDLVCQFIRKLAPLKARRQGAGTSLSGCDHGYTSHQVASC